MLMYHTAVSSLHSAIIIFIKASIRALAVRVIRDMVKAQPYSLNELNGLVISEILHLHKDIDKNVSIDKIATFY